MVKSLREDIGNVMPWLGFDPTPSGFTRREPYYYVTKAD